MKDSPCSWQSIGVTHANLVILMKWLQTSIIIHCFYLWKGGNGMLFCLRMEYIANLMKILHTKYFLHGDFEATNIVVAKTNLLDHICYIETFHWFWDIILIIEKSI